MAAAARDGGLLERTRGRARLIALAVAGVAAGLLLWRAVRGPTPALVAPGDQGPLVTVEVLNAAGRQGLARLVTRRLREQGIDVVAYRTAPVLADSTRLLVRRGGVQSAERVRRALGGFGRIEVERDSLLLLYVTIVLGADFPALDFHP